MYMDDNPPTELLIQSIGNLIPGYFQENGIDLILTKLKPLALLMESKDYC